MITLTEKMIEFIYYVQRSTDTNLKWVKRSRAPHFHLFNIEQVRTYKFMGEDIPVTDGTIFYVTDLPLFAASNHDVMWVKSYADAIKENLVAPMVMLRQHQGSDRLYPIPWEEIFIVKNFNYCYIIIDGIYNDIENICGVVCARKFTYSSNYTNEPDVGMLFNAKGQLICGAVDPKDPCAQGYEIHAKDIEVYRYRDFTPSDKGFILERAIQGQKIFLEDLIVTYEDYLVIDPSRYITHLEGNAFKFNPGVDPTKINVGIMYYQGLNLSLDKIRRKLTPEAMKDNALLDIEGIPNPSYTTMKPPLNLDDDPTLIDKWYAIMGWDKDLYKEITGEDPPVDDGVMEDPTKHLYYTGQDILDLTIDDKAIIENLRWVDSKFIDSDQELTGFCNALVFQNGALVKTLITSTNSSISFGTLGLDIKPDDKFEVVLMAYNEEDQDGIYENIKLNNYQCSEATLAKDFGLHAHNLMTFDNESIPDGEFDFTGKNLDMKNYYIMHKNEPFTDVAGDGLFKCKIDALDDYYKNKVLNVRFVAKNRFAYTRINVTGNDDTIEFELPTSFKYCQELNHYLVTINGRRIDFEYLKLTRPKHNNAFYELKLFCQVPTHDGDIVDIFYLPFEMVQVYRMEEIDRGGCVTIQNAAQSMPAPYSDKDYWVFLNGKKVRADYIQMPSDDTFAIIDPEESNKNFTLLFIRNFIDGTYEGGMTPVSDSCSGLTDAEIAALNGLVGIDTTEASIYNDCYDRESILKYIISKYYSNASDTTYMTYEEVFREDENEMLAALSTRKDAANNAYSVYKVGSYESSYDEQDLPPENAPLRP